MAKRLKLFGSFIFSRENQRFKNFYLAKWVRKTNRVSSVLCVFFWEGGWWNVAPILWRGRSGGGNKGYFFLQLDLLLVDGCMTTFRNVSTSSLPKKRSVFQFLHKIGWRTKTFCHPSQPWLRQLSTLWSRGKLTKDIFFTCQSHLIHFHCWLGW